MASGSSKRRRQEADELSCTGTSGFFRILLPGSGFQTRIEIPRKFARYWFGAKPLLPARATLRAQTSVSCSATITRRGDGLFLSDDGWAEFVKACTLQECNVLLFKYDGTSVFDVRILNQYLPKKKELKLYKKILQARKESGKKSEVSSTTNMRETTPIHTSYGRFKKSSRRINKEITCAYKAGKAAAVEMANQYIASNGMTDSTYIQVLMCTQLFEPFQMNFPKQWYNKYLTQTTKIVHLRDRSKIWELNPVYYPRSTGTASVHGGGWRQFVQENHLEKFDVCVISFVTRKDDVATVNVKIFRARSTMVTPQTSNTSSDLAPYIELDTSSGLDPHEKTETTSDVILYEPKDTSFDSPPFRATEMSTFSFIHHFERLWTSFPEEKLAQSTYLEWFHYERYHLGKTDVLRSIKEKNIFWRNYVFVPILWSGHWNLAIFCHFDKCLDFEKKKPCILLLDSLHMAEPWRLEKDIRKFVSGIYKNEGISDPRVSQIPFLIPKVPQQKGSECGYFSLYFIKKFMETAPEDGDMAFIDENWFTRNEFVAFCKSLENDFPQEMPPSTSRRILRRRRCNRPTSKGGDHEVITIE